MMVFQTSYESTELLDILTYRSNQMNLKSFLLILIVEFAFQFLEYNSLLFLFSKALLLEDFYPIN